MSSLNSSFPSIRQLFVAASRSLKRCAGFLTKIPYWRLARITLRP
jgi:hypothetical protein